MSVVIAVQESSEIEVMLDPNTKDANNKAASSKKSKTKPSSAKAKTSKKTKQGTTAQALPATQALPGNDVKTCGERRALLGPERKAAMRKGAKRAAQKFLVFMVSTVGLSCLVVAYAIVGGFIFMNLEGTAEQESRTAIKAIRERHVENLLNVTWNMNIFRKEEWRMEANKTFLEFQEEIYHAVKDMGWDGSDNVREKNTQWTYAGSLLFSVTVITTIGFGHLTPKTFWGRVVTMAYGLVGIPMTLLCLANIGSFMAHAFRLLWKQIVCKPCRKQLRRRSMYMAAKKASAAKFVGDMATKNRLGTGAQMGEGREGGGASGGIRFGGGSARERYNMESCADSPAAVHDSASLLGKPDPPRYSSLDHSESGRFLMGFEGLAGRDSVSSNLHVHEGKDRTQSEGRTDEKAGQTRAESEGQQLETQGEGQMQGEGQTQGQTQGGGQMQGECRVDRQGQDDGQEPEQIKCQGQSPAEFPAAIHHEPRVTEDQFRKCFAYPMVHAAIAQCNSPPSSSVTKSPSVGIEQEATEAVETSLPEMKKPKRGSDVVRVPIMVCLCLVAAYICLGAMLFSLWENEWSYFDSCYFCFTTLSTIGFGDLVPGYDNKQWGNQAKRVSCTLYLLFGLAMLAMCFELIQAECRQIFAHLGRVLGFTTDEKVHKSKVTGTVLSEETVHQTVVFDRSVHQ